MEKKYLVEVPEEVGRRLEKSGSLSMHIENQLLVIRPDDTRTLIPQLRFCSYGIGALVLALAFLALMKIGYPHVRTLPWAGQTASISTVATFLSIVSGVVAFTAAFCHQKIAKRGAASTFSWRSLFSLVVACAMITALVGLAFGWLIAQLFPGLRLDLLTVTGLIFTAIAITNYLLINLAWTLSPGVVSNLMTVMIVGGVGFSMLTNSRKDWWRYNFSFLGTDNNANAWQFNITLIFAGLLMGMLVDYLFVNLRPEHRSWKTQVLRGLLLFLAACIAAIGIFPNNPEYHLLHDRISMWLVYVLCLLIIIIRWCLPEVTKQFLKLSYLIGAVIVADYVLFKLVHYFSLTAFELFSFILAAAWILLLFQYIENLLPTSPTTVPVRLVKVKKDQATDRG